MFVMDWSEKNSCIKCDRGGNLLACCENDCPLAIHEGCLGCPAEYDDSGRFHCPYCLYKQSVAELRRARESFLGKKKAFSIFMNEKVMASEKRIGENKTCEDIGQDESKTSDSNVNAALSEDDKTSKLNNNGIIDKPFQIDEEEKTSNPVDDSEDSAGSEGRDPSPEIHGGKINRTEEEKQLEEEDHETSAEKQLEEGDHETSAEKQMIQDEERETSSDHPIRFGRPKRGSKRSDRVDEDSDANLVQSKLLKQHGMEKPTSPTTTRTKKSATAMRNGNLHTEEVISPWRSRERQEPLAKLDTFAGAKRSKPLWTEEEEEALRAGVEAHSKESKLPWKKILEKGRASNQFDPCRSPGDLKGKWRRMSGR